MKHRCIAILGGSFDPVHCGHVALARHFVGLLEPDELRILPAGNPWQKQGLTATAAQRVDMLRLAFADQPVPVVIDQRELVGQQATYTAHTLRELRGEMGPDPSLVFLMGADQLQHLNTWQAWRELFTLAHLCAAARPGYALGGDRVASDIRDEFARRASLPAQIRSTSCGRTLLTPDLAVDISATGIRTALQQQHTPDSLVPRAVLDYIEQHHLYKS